MKAYVVCLSWNLLFHFCLSVFTISRSLDKQLIYCAASRYPASLHLNVARGARQFSLSTFCLWISRYVAESARKLVKYANCPDNSVKIEFFVYFSNRILSHDASTFCAAFIERIRRYFRECEKHYFFNFNAQSVKSVICRNKSARNKEMYITQ